MAMTMIIWTMRKAKITTISDRNNPFFITTEMSYVQEDDFIHSDDFLVKDTALYMWVTLLRQLVYLGTAVLYAHKRKQEIY